MLRTAHQTDLNPLEAIPCYKRLWTVEQTFGTAEHLLSRATAATRGRTLIINLPGGVEPTLAAFAAIAEHLPAAKEQLCEDSAPAQEG